MLNPVRFSLRVNLGDCCWHVSTERAGTSVVSVRLDRKVVGFIERGKNFLEIAGLNMTFFLVR